MPTRRSRASWMSRTVGAVCVANAKNLLHDLSNRGQRVELTPLDLVEETQQLGVVRDRVFEVLLRTRRRNGKYFSRKIAPAPLVEAAVALEERAVRRDLVPEHVDVLAAH